MRPVVTENGEQGATTMRVIAPGEGSWWASITRRVSARIVSASSTTESGGRPPSDSPRLIDPREAWRRSPTPAAVVHPDPASSTRPSLVESRMSAAVIRAQIGYRARSQSKSPASWAAGTARVSVW